MFMKLWLIETKYQINFESTGTSMAKDESFSRNNSNPTVQEVFSDFISLFMIIVNNPLLYKLCLYVYIETCNTPLNMIV